jgi:hypothetical protein
MNFLLLISISLFLVNLSKNFYKEGEKDLARKIHTKRDIVRDVCLGRHEITKSDHRRIFFSILFALTLPHSKSREDLGALLHQMCAFRVARIERYKRLLRRKNDRPEEIRRLKKLSKRF